MIYFEYILLVKEVDISKFLKLRIYLFCLDLVIQLCTTCPFVENNFNIFSIYSAIGLWYYCYRGQYLQFYNFIYNFEVSLH